MGRVDLRERPVGRQPDVALRLGKGAGRGLRPAAAHTFTFGGVKGRSVLLWLTQLPAGQNNSGEAKHFVDVAEVKVA